MCGDGSGKRLVSLTYETVAYTTNCPRWSLWFGILVLSLKDVHSSFIYFSFSPSLMLRCSVLPLLFAVVSIVVKLESSKLTRVAQWRHIVEWMLFKCSAFVSFFRLVLSMCNVERLWSPVSPVSPLNRCKNVWRWRAHHVYMPILLQAIFPRMD